MHFHSHDQIAACHRGPRGSFHGLFRRKRHFRRTRVPEGLEECQTGRPEPKSLAFVVRTSIGARPANSS